VDNDGHGDGGAVHVDLALRNSTFTQFRSRSRSRESSVHVGLMSIDDNVAHIGSDVN
jgi:hypothetical protein